jgi:hypothetical protein
MVMRLVAWLRAGPSAPPWNPGTPTFAQGPQMEGLKGASEIAKQLITLSVGMIALTITFLKDIVDPASAAGRGVPTPMVLAWIAYTACILASVATLMGICGAMTVLDQKAMGLNVRPEHEGAYDVYASTVRIPMALMIFSFLAAIGLTIGATVSARPLAQPPVERDAPACVCRSER